MPSSIASTAARNVIYFYRMALRPVLPTCCKHEPTCSHYAEQAISRHGFLRGARYALFRLIRCHPFSRGGYDPVPGSD